MSGSRDWARSNAAAAVFLVVYAATLLALLPHFTLWLDEILTLIAAGKPDVPAVIGHLRSAAGGTPLAFLVPHWSMQALGNSPFAGRLPSALASIAACAGVWLLALRSGMRWPLAALAVFAMCPLQFRYAMEARPYALALCLSIWTTVIIVRPWSRWLAVAYVAIVVASGLTLAYALFVPAGHFLWQLTVRGERRKLFLIALAGSLAAGILGPWYLYFREDWARELAAERIAGWDWRSGLVFLREITGAGYAGTLLAAVGVGWGVRRAGSQSMWIWWGLTPLLLVPFANLAFGYFFAVRQMIYALAPLALLFVLGTESARRGAVLLFALLAAFFYEDVRWVVKPREDWTAAAQAAASALQAAAARNDACIFFVPGDAEVYYGYSHPGLLADKCAQPTANGSVVLAVSPYDPDGRYQEARDALVASGHAQRSEAGFNGPRVELWDVR